MEAYLVFNKMEAYVVQIGHFIGRLTAEAGWVVSEKEE